MKTATVAGIILVIIGIVSLAYGGINYTTRKKVLDMGPIQATKQENHSFPLSPVFGGLILVGGIILIAVGSKGSA